MFGSLKSPRIPKIVSGCQCCTNAAPTLPLVSDKKPGRVATLTRVP